MIFATDGTSAPDAQLAQLAAALLANADSFGIELAEVVRAQVPFYRDVGIVEVARLERSCTANLRFLFEAIARNAPADPAPARATGAERAEGGVPLAAVMAAYRVAMRFMWQRVVDEAERIGVGSDTVLAATAQGMVAHDLFTHEMAAAYNERLTARIVAQEAERSALVEAVLTNSITERKSLWEAADLLGLPTTGPYVVVAADMPRPGKAALPDIAAALAGVGVRSAWRLLSDLQVGIVAVPDARTHDLLVARLESDADGRIGVSPSFPDLAESGRALDFARLTVASHHAGKGVSLFTANPVGIAAVGSPDVMRAAVGGILAPLEQLPAGERETMLDTLRVWIDSGGSSTKAAARLFCHPNTIRYRLRRIEELTERRLHRPADAAAMCLALTVLDTHPG